jgi:dinuclear metal center YbgI/SA1388 family protein
MTTKNASLLDVVQYLDAYLRIADIPDHETALNGLQVENSGSITGIVAAVDASQRTIDRVAAECPRGTLLIVHHGLFWDGNQPMRGRRYRRIKALFNHDIAVYGAHIPLDVHPEVGNNNVLARSLGVLDPVPFDSYRGIPFGASGHLIMSRDTLVARLVELLGSRVHLIPGGPETTTRVGVITGAAGGRIEAAVEAGLDTFISGEGMHHTTFDALELGINVLYAGHYATETMGVKALAEHLAGQFGLGWAFHDHPTGM